MQDSYLICGKIWMNQAPVCLWKLSEGSEHCGSHENSSLNSYKSLGKDTHHLDPLISALKASVYSGSICIFVPIQKEYVNLTAFLYSLLLKIITRYTCSSSCQHQVSLSFTFHIVFLKLTFWHWLRKSISFNQFQQ